MDNHLSPPILSTTIWANKMNKFKLIVEYFGSIAFVAACFIGWVANLVWTFHQFQLGGILLGILGAVVYPIGAFHGIIYLIFGV